MSEVAALLGFFSLGYVIWAVATTRNFWMPSDEQYARIRQDKEDGMRVNIKPEQQ